MPGFRLAVVIKTVAWFAEHEKVSVHKHKVMEPNLQVITKEK
jgi:hypothetical protein